MRRLAFLLSFFLLAVVTRSQSVVDGDSIRGPYLRQNLNKAEITALYSYYEQDGDHSPVLGGIGTEYLTDHVGQIKVFVPIKNHSVVLSGGIDHYTSASTDNINPRSVSSASVVDNRVYANLSWSQDRTEQQSYGLNIGFSKEWDVKSLSGGFFHALRNKSGNTEFNISGQYFQDQWEMIYPIELRNRPDLKDREKDIREVYSLSLSLAQHFTKYSQGAIILDGIYQKGLNSTPFHRVYFRDTIWPDIEQLPRERIKIPIGLKWHQYISSTVVLRSYYRYYSDNFGIKAHTANVEVPLRFHPAVSVTPFYRFHTQTASKYFAGYKEHSFTEEFYSSDYDLSAFQSHHSGIGLQFYPSQWIWSPKLPYLNRQNLELSRIDLRAAIFRRTDGLKAWICSMGIKCALH